jgi:hypothetical protein
LHVTLEADADGHITAQVAGSNDSMLNGCVAVALGGTRDSAKNASGSFTLKLVPQ